MTGDRYSPAPAPAARGRWRAPAAGGPLRATVTVPGSKSLTNRELILAALADGPSRLARPAALRRLRAHDRGAAHARRRHRAHPGRRPVRRRPASSPRSGRCRAPRVVDCGQAGTVMRFVAGLAGFARGDVTLTAHESALHRPMGTMIKALRDVGVDIDDGGTGRCPSSCAGTGTCAAARSSSTRAPSSQFVSGLLLAAPRFDVGLHLVHRGERLPSMPHIDMTIESLAHRGVHVERPAPGEWVVPAGPLRAKDIAIEPDLSNAAPFLAAAMIAGGSVSVTGWPAHSTQPGAMLTEILSLMGARASRRGGALTVTAGTAHRRASTSTCRRPASSPRPSSRSRPSPTPTSTFYGIGHIRGHETDRIAALVSELRALGGEAHELADGIRIVPRPLHGGTWRAHHDHRLATTGALIGLAVAGRRDRRHRHDGQDDAGVPAALAATCSPARPTTRTPSRCATWLPRWSAHGELARRRRRRRDEFDETDICGSGPTRRRTVRAPSAGRRTPTRRSPACSASTAAATPCSSTRTAPTSTGSSRRAPASCAACRSSRATARASSATRPATTAPSRASSASRSAPRSCAARRRHRPGRARHRRQRRSDARRRRRGRPRAARAPRRPLPRRRAGCRHPPAARRHQDRPRRPDRVPRPLRGPRPRGVHERAGARCRSSASARSSSGTPPSSSATPASASRRS